MLWLSALFPGQPLGDLVELPNVSSSSCVFCTLCHVLGLSCLFWHSSSPLCSVQCAPLIALLLQLLFSPCSILLSSPSSCQRPSSSCSSSQVLLHMLTSTLALWSPTWSPLGRPRSFPAPENDLTEWVWMWISGLCRWGRWCWTCGPLCCLVGGTSSASVSPVPPAGAGQMQRPPLSSLSYLAGFSWTSCRWWCGQSGWLCGGRATPSCPCGCPCVATHYHLSPSRWTRKSLQTFHHSHSWFPILLCPWSFLCQCCLFRSHWSRLLRGGCLSLFCHPVFSAICRRSPPWSQPLNSRKGQRTNQKYRNLVGSDQQMQRPAWRNWIRKGWPYGWGEL